VGKSRRQLMRDVKQLMDAPHTGLFLTGSSPWLRSLLENPKALLTQLPSTSDDKKDLGVHTMLHNSSAVNTSKCRMMPATMRINDLHEMRKFMAASADDNWRALAESGDDEAIQQVLDVTEGIPRSIVYGKPRRLPFVEDNTSAVLNSDLPNLWHGMVDVLLSQNVSLPLLVRDLTAHPISLKVLNELLKNSKLGPREFDPFDIERLADAGWVTMEVLHADVHLLFSTPAHARAAWAYHAHRSSN